ncbi:hypothetical protein [Nocardia tengchongensis]|uniref:hypothetical protein n=1 Tax=Nocardia tengchongensis TaxID=2055889 RepID=UPI003665B190
MKTAALLAVLALPLLLTTSCGSDTDTSAPQTTSAAAPKYAADEQAALDALHGACSENDGKLYAEAKRTNELLQKGGVTDETTLTVLQHLRDSLPEGTQAMKCSDVLGSYVVLRTKGS